MAHEVAAALDAPWDVFVVRKLGAPGQEELAMGAIASGGEPLLNRQVIEALGIPRSAIERVVEQERRELQRRELLYRGERPCPDVENKAVIVVDDGLATGASMRAAVEALRARRPAKLVLAVPVAAPATCEQLEPLVDLAVCAETPAAFVAVGQWYEDFGQISDREVRELLEQSSAIRAER